MKQLYALKEGEELLLDYSAGESNLLVEQRWLRIPTDQAGELRYIVTTVTDSGGLDTAEMWLPDPSLDPITSALNNIQATIEKLDDPTLFHLSVEDFVSQLEEVLKKPE